MRRGRRRPFYGYDMPWAAFSAGRPKVRIPSSASLRTLPCRPAGDHVVGSSSSQWTLRWREMDSNFRFPNRSAPGFENTLGARLAARDVRRRSFRRQFRFVAVVVTHPFHLVEGVPLVAALGCEVEQPVRPHHYLHTTSIGRI